MNHTHDIELLNKILANGLCRGAGDGKTTFCAEQAVAVLCGIPVTDHPDECVTPSVSAFGRQLNDKHGWGDEKTRAAGMRNFLLAQIGSKDVVDGVEFSKRLALKTIQRILPIALRAAKVEEKWALACEQAGYLKQGRKVAQAARDAANAANAAAAEADAYAAAANADAADAADAAYAAANANANAADAAAYAADAAAAERVEILTLAANIAVEVLRELNSPGVELIQV